MKKFVLSIVALLLVTGCSFMENKSDESIVLNGEIEYTVFPVTSTVTGRIIEMNKQLGEPVKKGETIAVIDTENQQYVVEQLQAAVEAKQARLDELLAGTRPQQLQQAEAHVRAAQAQLDLLSSDNKQEQIKQAKNQVAIASEALTSINTTITYWQKQYNKMLLLYKEGSVAQTEVDQIKLNLDTMATQKASLQYQLDSAKQQLAIVQKGATDEEKEVARANYDAALAQLELLQSGATNTAIQGAQAEVKQATAQLKQAKKLVVDAQLKALTDGIVISKNVELGDVIQSGSNVADIASINETYVLAYIPNKHLDKITYGQKLQVKTSVGTQTGKVIYINLTDEYTPKEQRGKTNEQRTTKIKVAIDNKDGKLKPPMEAEILIPLK